LLLVTVTRYACHRNIDVDFIIWLTMHYVAMEDVSAGLRVFHLPVPLNSLA